MLFVGYSRGNRRALLRWVVISQGYGARSAAPRLVSGVAGHGGAPSADRLPVTMDGYHAYLRTPLQRHRAQWWLAAAGLAGLRAVPCPSGGVRSTLRLLSFHCADESLAHQGGARE
jgi:hypothetical protein